MSVELDPVELGFRRKSWFEVLFRPFRILTNVLIGPFNREVDEKLRIRNPNNEPVAFKVR